MVAFFNTIAPHTEKPVYGTFGLFRIFLATCVAIGHLAESQWYVGRQAVFLFFVLSGYVVSYILCNDYLKARNGLLKYAMNRFLRIYPLYFVSMLVAIVFAIIFPEITRRVDVRYFYTSPFQSLDALGIWFSNINLIGLAAFDGVLVKPNFIPVAWSIGTEIVYWILIPVLLLFRPLRMLALAVGIIYTVAFVALDYTVYSKGGYKWFAWRYFAAGAALLPFMAGVYIYLTKRHRASHRMHVIALLTGLFYIAFVAVTAHWGGANIYLEGFYIPIIIGTFLIYYLSGIDSRKLPAWLQWLENVGGNLAYGVLLFHMLVEVLVMFCEPSFTGRSWRLALTVIPLTYVVAAIAYWLVEKPMDKVRRKFRTKVH
jgi:peptidoglycan/LPS O-acetylase OafA/YrhL